MEFVPLVALGALVYTVINLLKSLRSGDFNGAATILSSAVAGVVAIVAYANSDFDIQVLDNLNLDSLNFVSQVLVGVNLGAVASTGAQVIKALDGSDSASVGPLTKLPSGK